MLITSVERNKKNKERFSVYIDDEYSFSISEEDYLTLNLYERREITPEEIDNIKSNVNFRAAKSVAVRYLSLKVRTEKEVFEKLCSHDGFDTEIAQRAIDELKAIGYINDKIYVQKYIYDRSKLKPKSKKALKYELLSRGVCEETIDEALNDWEMDEESVAETLVRRKFGKYDFKDQKVLKKVYAFLGHRGFSYPLIDSIVKRITE